MSMKNANLTYSSCLSLNSFQSLQKLREIFCKEPVNYENCFEKLLADSKFSLQDEPINSEFFTYYTVNSNSDFKKSNDTKPSDTQFRILEFLKNCIFSNQLFGSCQDTKTRNKACMCKPVHKEYKTEMKPKHGKHESPTDKNNNVIRIRDNSFSSVETKNKLPEEDISSKTKRERVTSTSTINPDIGLASLDNFGNHVKERGSTKRNKKGIESSTLTERDNSSNNNYRKTNTSIENQTETTGRSLKENQTSVDSTTSNNGNEKVSAEAGVVPLEMKSSQLPKIVLHLPVDFTQFGQQSTGNDLKLVLCANRKKQCNCESCGSNEKLNEGKDDKKKAKIQTDERKKKNKGLETDSLFRDSETLTDYDNLDPEIRAFPEKEKSKNNLFSCFKFFYRKSKSKQNQTEYSEVGGRENQNTNIVDEKKTKNVDKCCRCNKFDPECLISGEQIDTLKLLIKMEAKQNYRQINNIIKELNEQQEDIRKLRETHTRIVQHFPQIFEKKNAKGDYLPNKELEENVKTLFGMYKELSVKINEVHRLSKDIIRDNSEMLNNKHAHLRPLSDKTLSVKPPVEGFSDSSTTSKTEENNSRETNHPHYVEDLPEKLPKSETASAKKQTCPCEINSGIYSSNNMKLG